MGAQPPSCDLRELSSCRGSQALNNPYFMVKVYFRRKKLPRNSDNVKVSKIALLTGTTFSVSYITT